MQDHYGIYDMSVWFSSVLSQIDMLFAWAPGQQRFRELTWTKLSRLRQFDYKD